MECVSYKIIYSLTTLFEYFGKIRWNKTSKKDGIYNLQCESSFKLDYIKKIICLTSYSAHFADADTLF